MLTDGCNFNYNDIMINKSRQHLILENNLNNMPTKNKTKGQLEAEISEAFIKFEKEYMGRGPKETKTFIIDDMILVRHRGVLTPAEKQLAKVADPTRGCDLIKQVRKELVEKARVLLESIIHDILGNIKAVSMHMDISTVTGEKIIIFTLEKALELESMEENQ